MKWLAWSAIALVTLTLWMAVATPTGDLWDRWTDHLRHQGEAVALIKIGPALYQQTYSASTEHVQLPCPQHAGLWADTGVPYPPLGVLIHLPFALAERATWISPATSHRVIVWAFGFIGLLTTYLAARLLKGWRRWLFVAIFGPLLIGTGFSGFFDTTFALAAVLAATHGRGWAVVAYLLHFRGVVALAHHSWKRAWGSLTAIALNSIVAVVASMHLGVFAVSSRLHFSQPQSWWFPPVTAALWWFVRKEGFGWPVIITAVVMFTDRQRMFWHMLVFIPLVLDALRRGTTRTALMIIAWSFIAAQAAMDTFVPFNLIWLGLRGAD